MRILDTHQHLLYPDRFRYEWVHGLTPLEGKAFRLEEYWQAAQGTGIEQTLFMEVDVPESQQRSEAAFFLKLAEKSGSKIAGVIASCRPEREGFEAHVESLLHPKLKGFRRILHTQSDELCENPLFIRNVASLAQHKLTYDLCLLPRQLPHAETLLRTASDVQFVLDHCGIPNIKDNELDPWRRHIRQLANYPNLVCKISGLVAYCDPQNAAADAIRPFVEHCIESFGWERVLFGGDWPVCNLTASLGNWVAIAKELVRGESLQRQEQFFFRNAERIYRLQP